MKKLYKYLPVLFLAVLGCGDDEAKKLSDSDYFPLRKGFYQVYSVHTITYELQAETRNVTYQLKTEVVDSFANEEAGFTYTIHRSIRNTVNDPWEFENVWSVRMNASHAIVYEENIPFVKIVFPAVENRRWDGNLLNSLPADEYRLTNTGGSYELVTGETVGDFIQVVHEDAYDPIIFLHKAQEFYVRDIGLVKRELTDLTYCTIQGQCVPGTQVIDHGTIYVQTLIEYGQN